MQARVLALRTYRALEAIDLASQQILERICLGNASGERLHRFFIRSNSLVALGVNVLAPKPERVFAVDPTQVVGQLNEVLRSPIWKRAVG